MLGTTQINQLKATLKESLEQNEIAGASLMIIHKGKEIFYHEDGFGDLENNKKIERDSIFRLYSMTKPVTAVAAMILLERGRIDLYDPVSKYLPGFKNQKVGQGKDLVKADREVMIKDLLSMTSGLVYDGDDLAGKKTEALFKELEKGLYGKSPLTTLEAMNKLGKCPLAYQPGASWKYGASADVLGAVIEVASGKRLGEFLEEEIFRPLDMNDTGFWVPNEKRDRLVKVYQKSDDDKLKIYEESHLGISNKMDRHPAFESGGAGLVSTIDDYSKFATMLMQGGCFNGKQILKQKTVTFLTTAKLNDIQQNSFENWITLAGHSYGNFMRVMTDCSKAGDLGCQDEYGWDGWLGCYFTNCPNEELTLLLMAQKANSGTMSLTRKLRNIILSIY